MRGKRTIIWRDYNFKLHVLYDFCALEVLLPYRGFMLNKLNIHRITMIRKRNHATRQLFGFPSAYSIVTRERKTRRVDRRNLVVRDVLNLWKQEQVTVLGIAHFNSQSNIVLACPLQSTKQKILFEPTCNNVYCTTKVIIRDKAVNHN